MSLTYSGIIKIQISTHNFKQMTTILTYNNVSVHVPQYVRNDFPIGDNQLDTLVDDEISRINTCREEYVIALMDAYDKNLYPYKCNTPSADYLRAVSTSVGIYEPNCHICYDNDTAAKILYQYIVKRQPCKFNKVLAVRVTSGRLTVEYL